MTALPDKLAPADNVSTPWATTEDSTQTPTTTNMTWTHSIPTRMPCKDPVSTAPLLTLAVPERPAWTTDASPAATRTLTQTSTLLTVSWTTSRNVFIRISFSWIHLPLLYWLLLRTNVLKWNVRCSIRNLLQQRHVFLDYWKWVKHLSLSTDMSFSVHNFPFNLFPERCLTSKACSNDERCANGLCILHIPSRTSSILLEISTLSKPKFPDYCTYDNTCGLNQRCVNNMCQSTGSSYYGTGSTSNYNMYGSANTYGSSNTRCTYNSDCGSNRYCSSGSCSSYVLRQKRSS